jgi:transglutaminase-like putative cysteine protease
MTLSLAERHRLALLGWVATVATSLSLYTAFQEKRYVLVAAGLSGLVVAIGMLWRQFHLPTLLAPIVQALVALELLLVGYAHHLAYGVLPTSATFRGAQDSMSAGLDIANRYAAPVPANSGLLLMTVGFITAVAILVDLLAAGLGRAPLSGLALLALYAVPVASLPDGVPALGFIPGAAAFMGLLMLSERERLAHWGRHVAKSTAQGHTEVVDTSGLASTGRRISVAAIAAAVFLPVLVPTFTTTVFDGDGPGNGNGQLSYGNPMVSLADGLQRRDVVDLMNVNSTSVPSYIRLVTLDEPRPDGWHNSGVDMGAAVSVDGSLPSPFGENPGIMHQDGQMAFQLLPGYPRNNTVWLPVPLGLRTLTLDGFPGEFAYVPDDETVTSRAQDSVSHVTSYQASFSTPNPTARQLSNAGIDPANIVTTYGEVPNGVPAVVSDVAHRVTAGFTTDYDKALALQSFFRDHDNFTYDLDAGYGDGYRAMSLFLQKRRGYCQHFAATMAMMARTLGIPSRVVVGFLAPSRDTGPNAYVFTSHDAHAWPELYFGGVGWVRFEPTPGNGAEPPSYTHNVEVQQVRPTTPTKTTPTGAGIQGRTSDGPAPTPSAGGGFTADSGNGDDGGVPPTFWLVLVVLIALALTPGTIRWGIRRSRLSRTIDGGPSSEYAWLELRDRILDLRLPWSGSLTPRARSRFVEPLIGGDPDGVAALDRLSLIVERARYASTPVPGAQPAEDARQIMDAIDQNAERGQRIRAFLWPSSLMPELRGGWARIRARLTRRPRLSPN